MIVDLVFVLMCMGNSLHLFEAICGRTWGKCSDISSITSNAVHHDYNPWDSLLQENPKQEILLIILWHYLLYLFVVVIILYVVRFFCLSIITLWGRVLFFFLLRFLDILFVSVIFKPTNLFSRERTFKGRTTISASFDLSYCFTCFRYFQLYFYYLNPIWLHTKTHKHTQVCVCVCVCVCLWICMYIYIYIYIYRKRERERVRQAYMSTDIYNGVRGCR